MAFLRLLTNRSVMKADAATPAQAWRIYHAMLASSEAVWLPEPESFEARWEKFAQRSGGAGSEWTDAYLAAFAIGHGSRFVTFHRDFRRFEPDGLKVLVLETQPSPRP